MVYITGDIHGEVRRVTEMIETLFSHRTDSAESATSRITDASTLSQEQLDAELEKGYNDLKAGNTLNVMEAFNSIRKD